MISMAVIGLGMVLSRGWLSTSADFVKGKVTKAGTDKPKLPSTPGGNGQSGFAPGANSGSGAGGGGGGSW